MKLSACITVLTAVTLAGAEPLIISDFEGSDYAGWQVSGDAFGNAPAPGTLPGQMAVEGFLGKGLVNSFVGGDKSKGRMMSAPFKIERNFITFLVGGGGFAGETCMNLLVDGKAVRTATGPNTEPGGSERLEGKAWDVAEFAGREARLEIVDQATGGWGHINVDHIAQSDDRGAAPLFVQPQPRLELTRRLAIDADFLQLPLKQRARGNQKGVERLRMELDGKLVRYVHAEFPAKDEKPDFVYSYDVREFRGRELTLRFKSTDADALERLALSNQEVIDRNTYNGPHRPRFHFSPRIGWMNDINGSYYQDGLYHVFYQSNPTTAGESTGFDMHWGHSVSKDLVHWEEWPIALFPDSTGQCYSGTAVMMRNHVAGLNDGAKLPTPALFVAATNPFSQHLTASVDGGRTWKRYAGNPVVANMGDGDRDPKVVWHEQSQHYVMVLYVGGPDTYRILRSKDLVKWEQTSVLPNWFECPEFLPMKSPTTGEELWLLYGCYRNDDPARGDVFHSNSCYQLGRFDGQKFTPTGKLHHAHEGPNYYGALAFINVPNNRHVMMGWARGTRFPNEPFNQCASVPLEMKLVAINGEDILCFEPVKELESLRGQPSLKLGPLPTREANARLAALGLTKEALLDVTVRFRAEGDAPVRVRIRDMEYTFDPTIGKLALKRNGKPMSETTVQKGQSIAARFLIDRGICESFWNGGEAAFAVASLHTDAGPVLEVEGGASVEELAVYPLSDIWN